MNEIVWGGFLRPVPDAAGPGPERPAPRGGGALGPAGAVLDDGLGRRRDVVHRCVVYGLYEYRWLGFEPGPGVAIGRGCGGAVRHGYLLEWSLSVDNIFVIALIFSYLKIPVAVPVPRAVLGHRRRHRAARPDDRGGHGAGAQFDWMFYVFGAILLLSALRMLKPDADEARRREQLSGPAGAPLRAGHAGYLDVEVLRAPGRADCFATPLFVALVIVDITDVVFAVDSIPAILAVTRDPFLVFTSNAFAILGLRSLYFAVAGLMAMFRYLKYSLVLILAFVGMKMLLVNHYHVPNLMSLAIIIATLGAGVLASMWATRRDGETERG